MGATTFLSSAWFLISMEMLSQVNSQSVEEYCGLDVFQPTCGENKVILMKSAFYGRMAIGKCIKQNYGHIGCKTDVLSLMDGFCSGRQSCSVKANHDVLVKVKEKSTVCPSDVSAYLSPEFTCLTVHKESGSNCQSLGYMPVSEDNGYIAISSNNHRVGNHNCPWRINLASGRKINITMLNFPPTPTVENAVPSSACYEIGAIKEGGKTATLHKCLNDARHKQIYFSNGGPVDLVIPNKETLDVAGLFILHYQASGCSDPPLPENTEVQREGDSFTIICKSSNQKWELKCQNGKWIGETGKCSSDMKGWSFLGLFDHEHPYGTAIVVGIGATLGVLLGGTLLYIIIAIFKRCQKSDYTMTYEYTDPSFAHIPTDYHADKSNLLIPDDKLFEQNSNTWGSQRHGNGNTLSRGGTDHSRVPLPPLPNDNNTLSYEKPLYNRNGNV